MLPVCVRGNTLKVKFVAPVARHHYERHSRQCRRGLFLLPAFPRDLDLPGLDKESLVTCHLSLDVTAATEIQMTNAYMTSDEGAG